ncbi:hypothetical protein MHYP_G00104940 [Metynnis hypsauchen]
MANPGKCVIVWVEVRYLGFHLGHRQAGPQIDKTTAITVGLRPKTKKEVVEGDDHPVLNIIRKLSVREAKYGTIEKALVINAVTGAEPAAKPPLANRGRQGATQP